MNPSVTEFEDIREYVFPLFVGPNPARLSAEEPIALRNSDYLGTSFFVSKTGVALTAGHCVPDPRNIPSGKSLLAIVWDGVARAQHVTAACVLDSYDIAILKVEFSPSKFLPLSFRRVHMGEDVVAIGIPSHSVSGAQKEFRCLKGHVTFAPNRLELSFPAPKGMSGSPVFSGANVVGVLSWNARSESLEDQVEETTETIGNTTKVTRVETRSVVNYGLAEPLHALEEKVFPICEDQPFSEFIRRLNSE